MNVDHSIRTSHSSTEGACFTTFLLQSSRRPQLATRKGTLSLTRLATSPPREGVNVSLFSQRVVVPPLQWESRYQ